MSEFVGVYPYSMDEAKRLDEVKLWRESHQENVACRNAIEEAIRQNFDGMYLGEDCIQGVVEQFGYKRTTYVLANSIQRKADDGRFSRGDHDWAKRVFIPLDKEHKAEFAVDSHPAVLDGFVNLFRKAYRGLGLFDHTHCLPNTEDLDFEGKVIVLSAQTLNEEHLTPQDQLWLCTGGFGSRAHARGRAVFATCLADGERTRWERQDFAGVLAESQLPNWAREKLEQMQHQSDGPTVGGMELR